MSIPLASSMTALLFAISVTAAVMRAVAVLSSGVVVNASPTRPVKSSRSLHVRPKSEQLGRRNGVGITSYYRLCPVRDSAATAGSGHGGTRGQAVVSEQALVA